MPRARVAPTEVSSHGLSVLCRARAEGLCLQTRQFLSDEQRTPRALLPLPVRALALVLQ